VDGTLIEAWAGQKSFQRKGSDHDPLNPPPPDRSGNPTVNWHKEKRSNDTHQSLTDSMARLYKKTRGAEARLGYLGHVLTENRNGLVVDVRLTQAGGTAEREAALAMLSGKPASQRMTLGGDRGYDTHGFVAATRELKVTPHVHKKIPTGAAPSTNGPPGTRVMASASENGNGWRRSSDGSRPSLCSAKHASVDWSAWAGCSPSPPPLTTWCGCAIFSSPSHRETCPEVQKPPGHLTHYTFRSQSPLKGSDLLRKNPIHSAKTLLFSSLLVTKVFQKVSLATRTT